MTRQRSFGICSVGCFIFVLVEVTDALLCCDNLIIIYILSVNFCLLYLKRHQDRVD